MGAPLTHNRSFKKKFSKGYISRKKFNEKNLKKVSYKYEMEINGRNSRVSNKN